MTIYEPFYIKDIKEFLSFKGSIEEYFDEHPRGAKAFFWCMRHGMANFAPQFITPERVDVCAKNEKSDAIMFASNLLTPDRLDECALNFPVIATEFAKNLITPERLKWCILMSYNFDE